MKIHLAQWHATLICILSCISAAVVSPSISAKAQTPHTTESTPQPNDSITLTPIIKIINDLSKEPVAAAQVCSYDYHTIKASSALSNAQGFAHFTITCPSHTPTITLLISKPGFISLIKSLPIAQLIQQADTLQLHIQPSTHTIPQVTVTGKSQKYQPKGSQGYQLAMAVAQQEQARRREDLQGHTYKRIDQITISWANFNFKHPWIQKLLPFLSTYLTSSKLTHHPILPLSQRQEVRRIGTSHKIENSNEEILYRKVAGVDQNIDDGTLSQALHEIFPPIDLFQSYIHLLDNEFPSPLSPTAHLHYRYYLTDTIVARGQVVQRVAFYPTSPIAPSFRGQLYITLGAHPQLIQSLLTTNKITNVGFLDQIRIKQSYAPRPHPTDSLRTIWSIEKEEMLTDVRLFLKALTLNIDHQRLYFDQDNPEDQSILHNTNPLIDRSNPKGNKYAQLLKEERLLTHTAELQLFIEKLRQNKLSGTILALSDMLSVDYIRTRNSPYHLYGGSAVEIGPISRIIEINPRESIRLQIGARTTAYLHPRHFLKGYLAYSSKVQTPTYDLHYLYSFLPKRYYAEEFPRHDISLQYQYEQYYPGEHHWSEQENTALSQLGEAHLSRQSLRHLWKATYTQDIHNECSIQLYYQHTTDYPIQQHNYIRVLRDKTILSYPSLQDALLGISIRWSPGEKIIEGSMQRNNWYQSRPHQLPILHLKHHFATPLLGGAYKRHRTEVTAEQKVWLGILGRIDYHIHIGKIWNSAPMPFLYSPPLNRSLNLYRNSFKLLGVDEVVADQWIALYTEWHLRGMISNRIPLIRQLKLRGLLSLNLLWAETTTKNQQKYARELFIFPHTTTEMHYKYPYIEVGCGIESIFNILRLDGYYRLPHPLLKTPESKYCIKLALQTTF